jgi:hypothetical protein
MPESSLRAVIPRPSIYREPVDPATTIGEVKRSLSPWDRPPFEKPSS